jgi:hypothetical protein
MATVIVVRAVIGTSLIVTRCKDGELVQLGVNDALKLLHNPLDNPISARIISLTRRGMHMLHHSLGPLIFNSSEGTHLERMQHSMFWAQRVRECTSKHKTPFFSIEVLQGCAHGGCFGIDVTSSQM